MTDWSKLKVFDLKKELSTRGLLQRGVKQDLVNRLTADDEKRATAETAPEIETDAPQDLQPRNEGPSIASDGGAQGGENWEKASNNESSLGEEGSAIEPPTEGLNTNPENLEGSTLIETSEEQTEHILPVANEVTNGKTAPTTDEATESTSQSRQIQNGEKQENPTVGMPSPEIVSDSQKRKRRSLTPDIPSDEAAKKKMRYEADASNEHGPGADEVMTTKDDAEWVEKHNGVDSAEVNAEAMEVGAPMEGVEAVPTIVDVAKEEVVIEQPILTPNEEGGEVDEASLNPDTEGNTQNAGTDEVMSNTEFVGNAESESPTHHKAKDGRFKDLFPTSKVDQSVVEDAMEGIETERIISPAIHPATTALYIRDFMRPLNSGTLKEYLAFLATPPSSEPDPSIIQEFYVDQIRTHAFVSFSNISAASRVRSAIHDTVWPEETNRKPLWADFIPAEKVLDWIDEEKSTAGSGRTSGKKFEVAYEEDYHGSIVAVLRESDPRNVPARQNSMAGIPSAPRGGMAGVPLGPRSNIPLDANPYESRNDMTRRPSQFPSNESSRLTQNFKSTTASPSLYYQPVPKELVKRRLDNMDSITREDYKRDEPAKENHRYTFEDGDKFVDRGPEVFEGIRPPRGVGRYRGGGNPYNRDRREGRGRDRDRYVGGGNRYDGGGGGYRGDDGYRGSGTRRRDW